MEVGVEYQNASPFETDACNVTLPDPHLDAGVVLSILGIVIVVLAEIFRTGSPGIPPYSTI